MLTMSIVTIPWSDHGAEHDVDGNCHHYDFNRKTEHVKYWIPEGNGCQCGPGQIELGVK
jgi:hypothetical protein